MAAPTLRMTSSGLATGSGKAVSYLMLPGPPCS
ncbi:Uncharacterised protein [Bordetella pertussis]|nr:Uncharacterised protein [Bordetella pertussis]